MQLTTQLCEGNKTQVASVVMCLQTGLRYLKHYCHPLFIWHWCLSCSHAEKTGEGFVPAATISSDYKLMGSWATKPLVRL